VASRLQVLERRADLAEREHAIDDGSQPARRDRARERLELLAVADEDPL